MDKAAFINQENYNGWEKIFWRLKYFFNFAGKVDFDVLLFCLRPVKIRFGWPLMDFLEKKNIVKCDRQKGILSYQNLKFKLPVGEMIAGDLIAIFGNRDEYFKRNFLRCFPFDGPYEMDGFTLRPGDYVIDAGANAGFFSILASETVGPSGKVFAFEPIPLLANLLEETIELNKKDNIHVIAKGLGAVSGRAQFNLFDNYFESSGFFEAGKKVIQVELVGLDDFVKENKIPQIDFIKADIEGMERDLLAGAKATIAKFKPKLSLCIYHRPDDKQVLTKIIKGICADYKFIYTEKKLFAQI